MQLQRQVNNNPLQLQQLQIQPPITGEKRGFEIMSSVSASLGIRSGIKKLNFNLI